MITERLMAPGSYTIPLRIDAPYGLWATIKKVDEAGGGHIVITPERLNPTLIGDAGMLAAARYTGPVLEKKFTDGALSINGAGMGWWLGDDETGDVYESLVSLSSATVTQALTALLPSAITQGAVSGTSGLFTGSFHYDIPRDAIATHMATVEAEYRINPDGTMDAGYNTTIFNINDDDIQVVVVRFGSGSDPNLLGVPTATLKSVENARRYATRALLVDVASDGTKSLNAAQDQTPTATGKDIHGNTLVRTLVYESAPGTTVGRFLKSELGEHLAIHESTVSTGFWELTGGTWNVGDAFWVYDDPAFVDTDNQVRFRGDAIHPKKMRLLAATWPLVDGMGVSYRDDAGTYTDLTDWIKWESQDQSIGLGLQGSDLGRRLPGASTLTVRSFVARETDPL